MLIVGHEHQEIGGAPEAAVIVSPPHSPVWNPGNELSGNTSENRGTTATLSRRRSRCRRFPKRATNRE